jgi:hypothetical protein
MSSLGRAIVRMLPAECRDWAEAAWGEAREVPPGWPRLAWRAGGVRVIAREAHMARGAGTLLLFTAAAGAAAWSAWPGSAVSHAARARADIIVVIMLLAGLPLLSRRLLAGPGNRAAWWLRAGCYAAILATMVARAVTQLFTGAVPRGGLDLRIFHAFDGRGAPGAVTDAASVNVPLLIVVGCGLAIILALTARRARVAPATLVVGTGAGMVLGAAMYATDPLGIDKYATAPWLHASMTDTVPAGLAQYLVALAWVMLFGAPLAAGLLAARRCHVPGTPGQDPAARAWQGAAAGLVVAVVGALSVTVAGTGTTALLIKSARARDLLYHGQHLTASAVYGRELFASQNVGGYAAACLVFPVIGLVMGLFGGAIAEGPASRRPGGGHPPPPPGPPGPEPVPDPPDGRRLVGAGASQDRLPGRYDLGENAGGQAPASSSPAVNDSGIARVLSHQGGRLAAGDADRG